MADSYESSSPGNFPSSSSSRLTPCSNEIKDSISQSIFTSSGSKARPCQNISISSGSEARPRQNRSNSSSCASNRLISQNISTSSCFEARTGVKLQVLFTKKLTDADVKYRMVVPVGNYLQDLFQIPEGELSKQLIVIDMDDNSVKKFTCSKRRNGHPKLVLSKGWIGFVREKHLVAGDEVIFYMEEDGTGRITFKILARKIPCVVYGCDLRNYIRITTYFRQQ